NRLGEIGMAHPGVNVGNPQPRQVIVWIGSCNLLQRGERLAVAPLLCQLNSRVQVNGGGTRGRRHVLREQEQKNREQHTCDFGCSWTWLQQVSGGFVHFGGARRGPGGDDACQLGGN